MVNSPSFSSVISVLSLVEVLITSTISLKLRSQKKIEEQRSCIIYFLDHQPLLKCDSFLKSESQADHRSTAQRNNTVRKYRNDKFAIFVITKSYMPGCK